MYTAATLRQTDRQTDRQDKSVLISYSNKYFLTRTAYCWPESNNGRRCAVFAFFRIIGWKGVGRVHGNG